MKKFINKILDVPKLIRRIWLLLWICLVILLVMKFCFGIWYPIVVKNEVLINFNNFVSSNWLKYVVLGAFYLLNGNFAYLTGCQKLKYNHFVEAIIINILTIGVLCLKYANSVAGTFGEIMLFIVVPIIYSLKYHKEYSKLKNILIPIIVQGLVMIWQCNILLVRGLPNVLADVEVIIQIVLQLDYYIFLIILYLEVNYMSYIGLWFFGKDITTLKAEKEKELKKAKPNMKKVEAIDSKIAELEKEGK